MVIFITLAIVASVLVSLHPLILPQLRRVQLEQQRQESVGSTKTIIIKE
jgi:hypothetical protein